MATESGFVETRVDVASPRSAVSWGAICAGAAVSVAASFVLTQAAAGLGYSLSYSAVATRGFLSAFTPTVGAGAMIVQVLCGAIGGYVAGRLRTIWHGVHDDEAHFRDMAHGLTAWAVATTITVLIGAAVLGPYADALAAQFAAPATPPTPEDARRAADIAAQAALFLAVGMLLSAFVAAVAGRIGGQRNEDMHVRMPRG